MTEPKPSLMPLLILGAIAAIVMSRMQSTPVDPIDPVDPQPVPVVASEHLTAALEYAAALQQHIQTTIAKLEAGELTTETEARDYLDVGRKAALKASFMPVAERDAEAFADGWTVEKQVARLRAMIKSGERSGERQGVSPPMKALAE